MSRDEVTPRSEAQKGIKEATAIAQRVQTYISELSGKAICLGPLDC